MWPAHHEFSCYATALIKVDCLVVMCNDLKTIQQAIDKTLLSKAINLAAVVRVEEGTATIQNGVITKSNSSVIELAAFKSKANIDKAMLELKKPQSDIDIHVVVDNLGAAWDDVQPVSYMNTSVEHAAVAMDDVGDKTVHRGLCTLCD